MYSSLYSNIPRAELVSIHLCIFSLFQQTYSWQFSIGDCPIVYNEPCSPKYVTYQLSYNLNGKNDQRQIDPFYPDLPREFDQETEIKIVIHGYGGLSVDSSATNVTTSYKNNNYNVISVDWSVLAGLPCFPTAYVNTWHVAQCTSILVVSMIANGMSSKNIHIIGFSLGAHIAGSTGTQLRKVAGWKLGRITGLDPALPFYATLNDEWKLDASDADFVDVVHTSALVFGKFEPSGHIDFYMNGGFSQPFCKNRPRPPLCSHFMSGIYFAESIYNQRKFIGIECKDLFPNLVLKTCSTDKRAVMGEYVNRFARGIYYVDTAAEPPFALGDIDYSFIFLK
ncbi:hypothetical protein WA026_017174 [Henosepilachna vigintioctopunctata]|uniref:Lipase domain-containing protein n=1 Tax=Henosepilachna vigintioctopunctata TaxID=420089 RepID=A0AAW1UP81_9CUCU